MLRFAGADPEQVVLRGFDTDHNIALPAYDWASTREWFLQQRRIPAEQRKKITLRAPNLRYASSGWLHMGEPIDYAQVPEIQASWDRLELNDEQLLAQGFSAGSQPFVMTIRARNVELFALILYPWMPYALMASACNCHKPERRLPVMRRVTPMALGALLQQTPMYRNWLATRTWSNRRSKAGLWDFWTQPVYGVWDDSVEQSDERQSQLGMAAAQAVTWWDRHSGDTTMAYGRLSSLTEEQRSSQNILLVTADVRTCSLLRE